MRDIVHRSGVLLPALASLALIVPGAQASTARFEMPAASEFSPAAGEKIRIRYSMDGPGLVTLEIRSPDGDTVRTLASKTHAKAGTQSIEWDGRDDEGRVVPDEAYHPRLHCACGGEASSVIDAREVTGGVVIERIRPDLSPDGTIAFDLPEAARTLVRVGIKGGAMLRAIDTWSPRSAGRIRVAWDGFDQSHAVHLLGQPGLTVLVTAFTLPEQSIITSGNHEASYLTYRETRGWPLPLVEDTATPLQRDGKRLSRQSRLPRSLLEDPRVSIEVIDSPGQAPSGAFRVAGPVTFRVDMPQADKWLLQQSLYEVGFFLDHEFISEEETGYTPISWRWDPAGVAPGEHTLTVNVSGFWGQVGVASVRVIVGEKPEGEAAASRPTP